MRYLDLVVFSMAFLLAGCTESLSELILVIDTDLEVPEELSRITLDITEGGETQVREVTLGAQESAPNTLTVFRRGSARSSEVILVVRGYAEGATEPLLSREYRTSLSAEGTRVLPVNLLRHCTAEARDAQSIREVCETYYCVRDGMDCDVVDVNDDHLSTLNCELGQSCLPRLEMCDGTMDEDGDGDPRNGFDTPDWCDGKDNDCDPSTPEGSGEVTVPPELCDGRDNDCDENTQEGSDECDLSLERCSNDLGSWQCSGVEAYEVEEVPDTAPFPDACPGSMSMTVESRLDDRLNVALAETFAFFGDAGLTAFQTTDGAIFFDAEVASRAVRDWIWDGQWGPAGTLSRESVSTMRPSILVLWQALIPDKLCSDDSEAGRHVFTWTDLRLPGRRALNTGLSVSVVLVDDPGSLNDVIEVFYRLEDSPLSRDEVQTVLDWGAVGVTGARGYTEVPNEMRPRCLGAMDDDTKCGDISGVSFSPLSRSGP